MLRLVLTSLFGVMIVTCVCASHGAVVIIDDGPSGSPNTTEITWTPTANAPDWNWRPESGTNNKPNSYNGTGSRFAFANDPDPIETATYTPDLPVAGLYRVDMWWPTFGWSNNVPVTVTHQAGTTALTVDQSTGSGQWNPLGTFDFDAGTSGSLMISSEGANQGASGVGPVADAVRFVSQGPDDPILATAYASSSHPINPDRPAANVVNSSGMTDEDGDGILETHEANAWGDGINWMTNSLSVDTDPWFAADFGEVLPLDMMKVWNFNAESGRTDRGVGTADLYVSTLDNVGIAAPDFSDTGVWTLLRPGQVFSEAPGTDDYDTPDEIGLGVAARWLALDIQSTQGSTSFVGLSEIQVFRRAAVAVIPEPASLAVWSLLAGLGIAAGWSRRKR